MADDSTDHRTHLLQGLTAIQRAACGDGKGGFLAVHLIAYADAVALLLPALAGDPGSKAMARYVAKETARKLGLTLGVPQERATTTGGRQDRCRGPLPPGHAETWGLLVAGTVLEGVAYGG